MKESYDNILQFLVDSQNVARMRCDYINVIRISRAIAAFEAPVTKEIFTDEFRKEAHNIFITKEDKP